METWPICYLHEVSVQQLDKLLSKICISSFLSVQKGISCRTFHGAVPGPAPTQCFSSDLNVGLQNILANFAAIAKPGKLQALERTALGVKMLLTNSSKEVAQLSVDWHTLLWFGFHITRVHKESIIKIQVKFQATWEVNHCKVIYVQYWGFFKDLKIFENLLREMLKLPQEMYHFKASSKYM